MCKYAKVGVILLILKYFLIRNNLIKVVYVGSVDMSSISILFAEYICRKIVLFYFQWYTEKSNIIIWFKDSTSLLFWVTVI